jgi:hypothetical protein
MGIPLGDEARIKSALRIRDNEAPVDDVEEEVCRECGAPWIVDENRCSANCQTLKEYPDDQTKSA